MAGKKRSSRRWTRLIGGLLGLGIVWGFYVSRTSDKNEQPLCMKQRGCLNIRNCFLRVREKLFVILIIRLVSIAGINKPNWVYYILGSKEKKGVAERTDRFRKIKSTFRICEAFRLHQSGYDRGHLCPAADMTHSAEAMEETFLMSNISPQLPVFNRGIWKSLEKQVRDWGEKERIYIVTGPVFKDNKGKIGRTGVTVPGFFYKVVYAPGPGK